MFVLSRVCVSDELGQNSAGLTRLGHEEYCNLNPKKQFPVEKRKLRNNVAEQFPTLAVNQVISNKADITVMKIFTHSGSTVMVYCLQGDPIFFEWEKQLYPSVYLLWKYPHLLPCLYTWPPVLDKMVNGADLMLPGVIVPTSGLPQLTRGQLCVVCLPDSAAPVALGWATESSENMIAVGMKGRGVQTIHCYKDQLWKHGSKSHPPQIDFQTTVQSTQTPEDSSSHPSIKTTNGSNGNTTNNSQELNSTAADGELVSAAEAGGNAMDLPTGDEPVSGNGDVEEITEGACAIQLGEEEEAEEEDDIPLAVKMDRLLYQCLLHSVKSKVKKSDLPLLTSSLYKNFILSCCPRNQTLDVKKSSYKKLSKFLQAMQQERLLIVRATKKGVDSVVDIDRSHPDVRAFVIPDNEQDDAMDTPQDNGTGARKVEETWSPPEVKEFFQVTPKMLPVLQATGYKLSQWLTGEDVRKAVTEYVKQEGLADKTDMRLVVLDPILHDAVIRKTETSQTHMKWDKLFSRSYRELTAGYQMLLGNPDEAANQGFKKGRIQPIELKIQRKSGNKTVTLITRLETFGIDPKDFSHRIQKGVSASSSVSALPGQNSGVQVLVQGNQVVYIEKMLTEHYKLPRKFIQGLELAPKAGKKR